MARRGARLRGGRQHGWTSRLRARLRRPGPAPPQAGKRGTRDMAGGPPQARLRWRLPLLRYFPADRFIASEHAKMQEDTIVRLGERSYPIRFCVEGLAEIGPFVRDLHRPTSCAVLSDENVAPLYAETVTASLARADFAPRTVVIPPGEEQKSLERLGWVCQRLLEAGLDRGSLLVALGGGVVGDVGGFAAATYMRGIPYVQVPTTLLAQVDSSIGGKTAVNLPQGKNLVGAFHQPIGVFIDASVLRTLPERELRAGMVEVIKHGIIRDADYFAWLEDALDDVMSLDGDAVLHAVRRSCEIKADVVAADEHEAGLRAILNYGHTVGHALEALSGYGGLLHGEAVAIGMEVAAALSRIHLGLSDDDAGRQHDILDRLGVPTRIGGASADAISEKIARDKKALGGRPRFVLARRIGQVEICGDVPPEAVRETLLGCGAAPG